MKNKREKLQLFGKAALMAMLPVFCCIAYCASKGRSLGEVYLPSSLWNDELFYFKQVEGILEYGYPLGYYGFNESIALKLSFAAWSPVLVLPWVIWGFLFGWTVLSPIYCNIFLMMVAMAGFVLLVRPSWKQIGILTLLFGVFTPFTRYMLCGMPEIICCSMLILFYSIAIHYTKSQKMWELFLLFGWAGVMTLMRPYLLLFLLLPCYFMIRRKKWTGVVISAVITGAVLFGYWGIKHYLGAAYFAPLFFTDWITTFFEQGFFAGIKHFFGKLYWMGKDVFTYTVEGFRSGLAYGAYYGGYLLLLLVLAGYSLKVLLQNQKVQKSQPEEKGKQKSEDGIEIAIAHLAFAFIGMFFAILLMYKITEGSRHLFTFMGAGIFLVSLMKTKFYKKAVLVGAVCFYLYSYMGTDPIYYEVPFQQEAVSTRLAKVEEVLKKELQLVKEEVPSFENVMVWVLSDQVEEEEKYTDWQVLYALPKGFGISCCQKEFVLENLEWLRSRYLTTVTGGEIDLACTEKGFERIYSDKDISIYRRASR